MKFTSMEALYREKLIYKILSALKGFRLAEPGEFAKRATINGNIDPNSSGKYK